MLSDDNASHDLQPMTLTYNFDLDMVKVNQHAKYLGQRIFKSYLLDA